MIIFMFFTTQASIPSVLSRYHLYFCTHLGRHIHTFASLMTPTVAGDCALRESTHDAGR